MIDAVNRFCSPYVVPVWNKLVPGPCLGDKVSVLAKLLFTKCVIQPLFFSGFKPGESACSKLYVI